MRSVVCVLCVLRACAYNELEGLVNRVVIIVILKWTQHRAVFCDNNSSGYYNHRKSKTKRVGRSLGQKRSRGVPSGSGPGERYLDLADAANRAQGGHVHLVQQCVIQE